MGYNFERLQTFKNLTEASCFLKTYFYTALIRHPIAQRVQLRWQKGGEMPRYKAQAPNFKMRGGAKEFILKDGRTYLILKFPDWSILVLGKTKGRKKALVEYKGVRKQKDILRKLECPPGTLYQMGAELFK